MMQQIPKSNRCNYVKQGKPTTDAYTHGFYQKWFCKSCGAKAHTPAKTSTESFMFIVEEPSFCNGGLFVELDTQGF